ncbi:disulfide isomerase-like 1-6 [Olea europaea subsp. europaea]|uniref:Disulfide isomerase-like 1-6 n=1 Tax=Olea europaea subsp. europaea TaxID=158383 RepID=A0A8S0QJ78_OLEEU|nr:disulfide isomerase-like 1-6 [Olea europaea subsp. europaea]
MARIDAKRYPKPASKLGMKGYPTLLLFVNGSFSAVYRWLFVNLAVSENKFPLVTTLTEFNSAKVYSSTNRQQVYVFADADDFKKLLEPLQDIAPKFKSKIIAFDYNNSAKYLVELDPAPRHRVQILIEFKIHTPWCINCETTSKQVEKLAKHFKGLENLVFSRIDASTNEHPQLQVEDYQTLSFYLASDKSMQINLPTKSSFKESAALINKHLKSGEPGSPQLKMNYSR